MTNDNEVQVVACDEITVLYTANQTQPTRLLVINFWNEQNLYGSRLKQIIIDTGIPVTPTDICAIYTVKCDKIHIEQN